MLRNVAVVVVHGFLPFEFGTICEVFGVDRADDGLPSYDFAVVAGEPPPLRAHNDFTIQPSCGLERLEEADLIALPAVGDDRLRIFAVPNTRVPPAGPPEMGHLPREFPGDLLAALRRAVDRGARVLSVCSGAFILGEAGLLDGRRCTTHWRNADELARRYPAAKVDPDVLYVDDDPVITSAGTAAGIDACLYLVRKEQGSRVANGIARRMVVPPHRDGGQAQYVDQPVASSCDGTLRDLLEWLRAHLDQPLTVRQLAVRANMSERTFARRFVQDTGTTPQRWLIGQRILLAQQLLEESDETVDAIADRTGFGNATALRHHFRAWRGTTPNAYRRLFRPPQGGMGGGRPPHEQGGLGGSSPRASTSSNIWFMRFLLRVVVSAAALGVATAAVPGIELPAGSGWSKLGTLLVVALIFGVINATLKPLIKVVGCAFYVLTFGLAALVVNGLLLWLTSVVAGDLTLPFHVTGFWPAFWGAIIVGLVSWLLHLLIGDNRPRDNEPPPVRVVRVR